MTSLSNEEDLTANQPGLVAKDRERGQGLRGIHVRNLSAIDEDSGLVLHQLRMFTVALRVGTDLGKVPAVE